MYLSIVAFIQVDSSTFWTIQYNWAKNTVIQYYNTCFFWVFFHQYHFSQWWNVWLYFLWLVWYNLEMIRERIGFYLFITSTVPCIGKTNIQHWMPCEGMKDDQCYNGAKVKYKISCKFSSIEEYFCGLTSHYKPYWNIVLSPPPEN